VVEDAPEAIRGSVEAGIKTVGVHALTGLADADAASLDLLPAGTFDRLVGALKGLPSVASPMGAR